MGCVRWTRGRDYTIRLKSTRPRRTSSSAVASWYCWYSDTRSFMLDSGYLGNSISSMPSPVYGQALRRNMDSRHGY